LIREHWRKTFENQDLLHYRRSCAQEIQNIFNRPQTTITPAAIARVTRRVLRFDA
jgi:hypothetical protein